MTSHKTSQPDLDREIDAAFFAGLTVPLLHFNDTAGELAGFLRDHLAIFIMSVDEVVINDRRCGL